MGNKQSKLNQEKITFKGYFKSLPNKGDVSKDAIKKKLRPFISESHFYSCLRNNTFMPIMRKEIESITGQMFNWENDEI